MGSERNLEVELADVPASDVTTVVTGLPRSGTSLAMQMLEAAGIPPFMDQSRQADESNPMGYYENRYVTRLMNPSLNKSWLAETRGKAVKIFASSLPGLVWNLDGAAVEKRPMHYRVIFIERDMNEVLYSQTMMLQRLDQIANISRPASLANAYRDQLAIARDWLIQHKVPSIKIQHRELLTNPDPAIERLALFIQRPDRFKEIKSVIRPELYRAKSDV